MGHPTRVQLTKLRWGHPAGNRIAVTGTRWTARKRGRHTTRDVLHGVPA